MPRCGTNAVLTQTAGGRGFFQQSHLISSLLHGRSMIMKTSHAWPAEEVNPIFYVKAIFVYFVTWSGLSQKESEALGLCTSHPGRQQTATTNTDKPQQNVCSVRLSVCCVVVTRFSSHKLAQFVAMMTKSETTWSHVENLSCTAVQLGWMQLCGGRGCILAGRESQPHSDMTKYGLETTRRSEKKT